MHRSKKQRTGRNSEKVAEINNRSLVNGRGPNGSKNQMGTVYEESPNIPITNSPDVESEEVMEEEDSVYPGSSAPNPNEQPPPPPTTTPSPSTSSTAPAPAPAPVLSTPPPPTRTSPSSKSKVNEVIPNNVSGSGSEEEDDDDDDDDNNKNEDEDEKFKDKANTKTMTLKTPTFTNQRNYKLTTGGIIDLFAKGGDTSLDENELITQANEAFGANKGTIDDVKKVIIQTIVSKNQDLNSSNIDFNREKKKGYGKRYLKYEVPRLNVNVLLDLDDPQDRSWTLAPTSLVESTPSSKNNTIDLTKGGEQLTALDTPLPTRDFTFTENSAVTNNNNINPSVEAINQEQPYLGLKKSRTNVNRKAEYNFKISGQFFGVSTPNVDSFQLSGRGNALLTTSLTTKVKDSINDWQKSAIFYDYERGTQVEEHSHSKPHHTFFTTAEAAKEILNGIGNINLTIIKGITDCNLYDVVFNRLVNKRTHKLESNRKKLLKKLKRAAPSKTSMKKLVSENRDSMYNTMETFKNLQNKLARFIGGAYNGGTEALRGSLSAVLMSLASISLLENVILTLRLMLETYGPKNPLIKRKSRSAAMKEYQKVVNATKFAELTPANSQKKFEAYVRGNLIFELLGDLTAFNAQSKVLDGVFTKKEHDMDSLGEKLINLREPGEEFEDLNRFLFYRKVVEFSPDQQLELGGKNPSEIKSRFDAARAAGPSKSYEESSTSHMKVNLSQIVANSFLQYVAEMISLNFKVTDDLTKGNEILGAFIHQLNLVSEEKGVADYNPFVNLLGLCPFFVHTTHSEQGDNIPVMGLVLEDNAAAKVKKAWLPITEVSDDKKLLSLLLNPDKIKSVSSFLMLTQEEAGSIELSKKVINQWVTNIVGATQSAVIQHSMAGGLIKGTMMLEQPLNLVDLKSPTKRLKIASGNDKKVTKMFHQAFSNAREGIIRSSAQPYEESDLEHTRRNISARVSRAATAMSSASNNILEKMLLEKQEGLEKDSDMKRKAFMKLRNLFHKSDEKAQGYAPGENMEVDAAVVNMIGENSLHFEEDERKTLTSMQLANSNLYRQYCLSYYEKLPQKLKRLKFPLKEASKTKVHTLLNDFYLNILCKFLLEDCVARSGLEADIKEYSSVFGHRRFKKKSSKKPTGTVVDKVERELSQAIHALSSLDDTCKAELAHLGVRGGEEADALLPEEEGFDRASYFNRYNASNLVEGVLKSDSFTVIRSNVTIPIFILVQLVSRRLYLHHLGINVSTIVDKDWLAQLILEKNCFDITLNLLKYLWLLAAFFSQVGHSFVSELNDFQPNLGNLMYSDFKALKKACQDTSNQYCTAATQAILNDRDEIANQNATDIERDERLKDVRLTTQKLDVALTAVLQTLSSLPVDGDETDKGIQVVTDFAELKVENFDETYQETLPSEHRQALLNSITNLSQASKWMRLSEFRAKFTEKYTAQAKNGDVELDPFQVKKGDKDTLRGQLSLEFWIHLYAVLTKGVEETGKVTETDKMNMNTTMSLLQALNSNGGEVSKTFSESIAAMRTMVSLLGWLYSLGIPSTCLKPFIEVILKQYAKIVMTYARKQKAFTPLPMALLLYGDQWNISNDTVRKLNACSITQNITDTNNIFKFRDNMLSDPVAKEIREAVNGRGLKKRTFTEVDREELVGASGCELMNNIDMLYVAFLPPEDLVTQQKRGSQATTSSSSIKKGKSAVKMEDRKYLAILEKNSILPPYETHLTEVFVGDEEQNSKQAVHPYLTCIYQPKSYAIDSNSKLLSSHLYTFFQANTGTINELKEEDFKETLPGNNPEVLWNSFEYRVFHNRMALSANPHKAISETLIEHSNMYISNVGKLEENYRDRNWFGKWQKNSKNVELNDSYTLYSALAGEARQTRQQHYYGDDSEIEEEEVEKDACQKAFNLLGYISFPTYNFRGPVNITNRNNPTVNSGEEEASWDIMKGLVNTIPEFHRKLSTVTGMIAEMLAIIVHMPISYKKTVGTKLKKACQDTLDSFRTYKYVGCENPLSEEYIISTYGDDYATLTYERRKKRQIKKYGRTEDSSTSSSSDSNSDSETDEEEDEEDDNNGVPKTRRNDRDFLQPDNVIGRRKVGTAGVHNTFSRLTAHVGQPRNRKQTPAQQQQRKRKSTQTSDELKTRIEKLVEQVSNILEGGNGDQLLASVRRMQALMARMKDCISNNTQVTLMGYIDQVRQNSTFQQGTLQKLLMVRNLLFAADARKHEHTSFHKTKSSIQNSETILGLLGVLDYSQQLSQSVYEQLSKEDYELFIKGSFIERGVFLSQFINNFIFRNIDPNIYPTQENLSEELIAKLSKVMALCSLSKDVFTNEALKGERMKENFPLHNVMGGVKEIASANTKDVISLIRKGISMYGGYGGGRGASLRSSSNSKRRNTFEEVVANRELPGKVYDINYLEKISQASPDYKKLAAELGSMKSNRVSTMDSLIGFNNSPSSLGFNDCSSDDSSDESSSSESDSSSSSSSSSNSSSDGGFSSSDDDLISSSASSSMSSDSDGNGSSQSMGRGKQPRRKKQLCHRFHNPNLNPSSSSGVSSDDNGDDQNKRPFGSAKLFETYLKEEILRNKNEGGRANSKLIKSILEERKKKSKIFRNEKDRRKMIEKLRNRMRNLYTNLENLKSFLSVDDYDPLKKEFRDRFCIDSFSKNSQLLTATLTDLKAVHQGRSNLLFTTSFREQMAFDSIDSTSPMFRYCVSLHDYSNSRFNVFQPSIKRLVSDMDGSVVADDLPYFELLTIVAAYMTKYVSSSTPMVLESLSKCVKVLQKHRLSFLESTNVKRNEKTKIPTNFITSTLSARYTLLQNILGLVNPVVPISLSVDPNGERSVVDVQRVIKSFRTLNQLSNSYNNNTTSSNSTTFERMGQVFKVFSQNNLPVNARSMNMVEYDISSSDRQWQDFKRITGNAATAKDSSNSLRGMINLANAYDIEKEALSSIFVDSKLKRRSEKFKDFLKKSGVKGVHTYSCVDRLISTTDNIKNPPPPLLTDPKHLRNVRAQRDNGSGVLRFNALGNLFGKVRDVIALGERFITKIDSLNGEVSEVSEHFTTVDGRPYNLEHEYNTGDEPSLPTNAAVVNAHVHDYIKRINSDFRSMINSTESEESILSHVVRHLINANSFMNEISSLIQQTAASARMIYHLRTLSQVKTKGGVDVNSIKSLVSAIYSTGTLKVDRKHMTDDFYKWVESLAKELDVAMGNFNQSYVSLQKIQNKLRLQLAYAASGKKGGIGGSVYASLESSFQSRRNPREATLVKQTDASTILLIRGLPSSANSNNNSPSSATQHVFENHTASDADRHKDSMRLLNLNAIANNCPDASTKYTMIETGGWTPNRSKHLHEHNKVVTDFVSNLSNLFKYTSPLLKVGGEEDERQLQLQQQPKIQPFSTVFNASASVPSDPLTELKAMDTCSDESEKSTLERNSTKKKIMEELMLGKLGNYDNIVTFRKIIFKSATANFGNLNNYNLAKFFNSTVASFANHFGDSCGKCGGGPCSTANHTTKEQLLSLSTKQTETPSSIPNTNLGRIIVNAPLDSFSLFPELVALNSVRADFGESLTMSNGLGGEPALERITQLNGMVENLNYQLQSLMVAHESLDKVRQGLSTGGLQTYAAMDNNLNSVTQKIIHYIEKETSLNIFNDKPSTSLTENSKNESPTTVFLQSVSDPQRESQAARMCFNYIQPKRDIRLAVLLYNRTYLPRLMEMAEYLKQGNLFIRSSFEKVKKETLANIGNLRENRLQGMVEDQLEVQTQGREFITEKMNTASQNSHQKGILHTNIIVLEQQIVEKSMALSAFASLTNLSDEVVLDGSGGTLNLAAAKREEVANRIGLANLPEDNDTNTIREMGQMLEALEMDQATISNLLNDYPTIIARDLPNKGTVIQVAEQFKTQIAVISKVVDTLREMSASYSERITNIQDNMTARSENDQEVNESIRKSFNGRNDVAIAKQQRVLNIIDKSTSSNSTLALLDDKFVQLEDKLKSLEKYKETQLVVDPLYQKVFLGETSALPAASPPPPSQSLTTETKAPLSANFECLLSTLHALLNNLERNWKTVFTQTLGSKNAARLVAAKDVAISVLNATKKAGTVSPFEKSSMICPQLCEMCTMLLFNLHTATHTSSHKFTFDTKVSLDQLRSLYTLALRARGMGDGSLKPLLTLLDKNNSVLKGASFTAEQEVAVYTPLWKFFSTTPTKNISVDTVLLPTSELFNCPGDEYDKHRSILNRSYNSHISNNAKDLNNVVLNIMNQFPREKSLFFVTKDEYVCPSTIPNVILNAMQSNQRQYLNQSLNSQFVRLPKDGSDPIFVGRSSEICSSLNAACLRLTCANRPLSLNTKELLLTPTPIVQEGPQSVPYSFSEEGNGGYLDVSHTHIAAPGCNLLRNRDSQFQRLDMKDLDNSLFYGNSPHQFSRAFVSRILALVQTNTGGGYAISDVFQNILTLGATTAHAQATLEAQKGSLVHDHFQGGELYNALRLKRSINSLFKTGMSYGFKGFEYEGNEGDSERRSLLSHLITPAVYRTKLTGGVSFMESLQGNTQFQNTWATFKKMMAPKPSACQLRNKSNLNLSLEGNASLLKQASMILNNSQSTNSVKRAADNFLQQVCGILTSISSRAPLILKKSNSGGKLPPISQSPMSMILSGGYTLDPMINRGYGLLRHLTDTFVDSAIAFSSPSNARVIGSLSSKMKQTSPLQAGLVEQQQPPTPTIAQLFSKVKVASALFGGDVDSVTQLGGTGVLPPLLSSSSSSSSEGNPNKLSEESVDFKENTALNVIYQTIQKMHGIALECQEQPVELKEMDPKSRYFINSCKSLMMGVNNGANQNPSLEFWRHLNRDALRSMVDGEHYDHIRDVTELQEELSLSLLKDAHRSMLSSVSGARKMMGAAVGLNVPTMETISSPYDATISKMMGKPLTFSDLLKSKMKTKLTEATHQLREHCPLYQHVLLSKFTTLSNSRISPEVSRILENGLKVKPFRLHHSEVNKAMSDLLFLNCRDTKLEKCIDSVVTLPYLLKLNFGFNKTPSDSANMLTCFVSRMLGLCNSDVSVKRTSVEFASLKNAVNDNQSLVYNCLRFMRFKNYCNDAIHQVTQPACNCPFTFHHSPTTGGLDEFHNPQTLNYENEFSISELVDSPYLANQMMSLKNHILQKSKIDPRQRGNAIIKSLLRTTDCGLGSSYSNFFVPTRSTLESNVFRPAGVNLGVICNVNNLKSLVTRAHCWKRHICMPDLLTTTAVTSGDVLATAPPPSTKPEDNVAPPCRLEEVALPPNLYIQHSSLNPSMSFMCNILVNIHTILLQEIKKNIRQELNSSEGEFGMVKETQKLADNIYQKLETVNFDTITNSVLRDQRVAALENPQQKTPTTLFEQRNERLDTITRALARMENSTGGLKQRVSAENKTFEDLREIKHRVINKAYSNICHSLSDSENDIPFNLQQPNVANLENLMGKPSKRKARVDKLNPVGEEDEEEAEGLSSLTKLIGFVFEILGQEKDHTIANRVSEALEKKIGEKRSGGGGVLRSDVNEDETRFSDLLKCWSREIADVVGLVTVIEDNITNILKRTPEKVRAYFSTLQTISHLRWFLTLGMSNSTSLDLSHLNAHLPLDLEDSTVMNMSHPILHLVYPEMFATLFVEEQALREKLVHQRHNRTTMLNHPNLAEALTEAQFSLGAGGSGPNMFALSTLTLNESSLLNEYPSPTSANSEELLYDSNPSIINPFTNGRLENLAASPYLKSQGECGYMAVSAPTQASGLINSTVPDEEPEFGREVMKKMLMNGEEMTFTPLKPQVIATDENSPILGTLAKKNLTLTNCRHELTVLPELLAAIELTLGEAQQSKPSTYDEALKNAWTRMENSVKGREMGNRNVRITQEGTVVVENEDIPDSKGDDPKLFSATLKKLLEVSYGQLDASNSKLANEAQQPRPSSSPYEHYINRALNNGFTFQNTLVNLITTPEAYCSINGNKVSREGVAANFGEKYQLVKALQSMSNENGAEGGATDLGSRLSTVGRLVGPEMASFITALESLRKLRQVVKSKIRPLSKIATYSANIPLSKETRSNMENAVKVILNCEKQVYEGMVKFLVASDFVALNKSELTPHINLLSSGNTPFTSLMKSSDPSGEMFERGEGGELMNIFSDSLLGNNNIAVNGAARAFSSSLAKQYTPNTEDLNLQGVNFNIAFESMQNYTKGSTISGHSRRGGGGKDYENSLGGGMTPESVFKVLQDEGEGSKVGKVLVNTIINKGQNVLSNAFLGVGVNQDVGEGSSYSSVFGGKRVFTRTEKKRQETAILNTLKSNPKLFNIIIKALANHETANEYISQLSSSFAPKKVQVGCGAEVIHEVGLIGQSQVTNSLWV